MATAPMGTLVSGGGPSDLATAAPTTAPDVATSMYSATQFLYIGSNPVQTGVQPGAIVLTRTAVLRGVVSDKDSQPLPGVTITILGHPEFGQTVSRASGQFDMVVNGGGPLIITYAKDGYLLAQRQVQVPWQDYVPLPGVALLRVDPRVTDVTLSSSSTTVQVAQGSVISDTDGQRQATLLFDPGTTAVITATDGTTRTLSDAHVRATEYTVGANGPAAMPAALPPSSGYTYAVEFSVDEAQSAGAASVGFSRPVYNYVDNFLHFPVGLAVPTGYYDRQQGAWIASRNGRVVGILSVTNGMADLDVDGQGRPATAAELAALGVTDGERQKLAGLYAAGKTLWRVPITHFTPWDHNYPYGPPADAAGPNNPSPAQPSKSRPCQRPGSIIGCQNQALGESVPVVGTSYNLRYESDRVPGRADNRTLNIPLSGPTMPASLKRIDLDIQVAGQDVTRSFSPTTNMAYTFVWDDKDAYGRVLQGQQQVTIRVGYVYGAVYQQPAQFDQSFARFSGFPLLGSRARQEITLYQQAQTTVGAFTEDPRADGLGGWTIDIHHVYDPMRHVLYRGDGGERSAQAFGQIITNVAGSSVGGAGGDGGAATGAQLDTPAGVAVAPDGSLYIADMNNNRVRRVALDGTINTVVGNGQACSATIAICGDGGPALLAQLYQPSGIALGPDGSLYIADSGDNRVRRVAAGPDGTIPVTATITTVAGTGAVGSGGDGGPATKAQLAYPSSVALNPHGDLYIADENNGAVREVALDGTIATIAGNGQACYPYTATCGDGGPASRAQLESPTGVAVGPDGSLYVADFFNRVRRVGPDGIIKTVAGTGADGFSGDGGQAAAASLSFVTGVAVAPDGSLYIANEGNRRLRKVSADGVITTVAGNGQDCLASTAPCGDNGLATAAKLPDPNGLAAGPDGSLYIADTGTNRVRRVGLPLQSLSSGEIAIPSDDGGQVYVFDNAGRHLRTLDGLTGGVRYRFGYDPAGRLSTVTDGDGNGTTIQHDASGNPTAIVAPGGQRTTLATDTNGYLASIADPLGETTALTYTATGLLTAMTDPMGNPHTFSYDDQGRLTKDQEPTGGYTALSRVDSASGYTVTVSTALNRVTTYAEEFLSDGGQSETTIDPNGGLTVARTGPDGVQHATYPDGTSIAEAHGPDPRWGVQVPILAAMTETVPSGLSQTVLSTRTVALADSADPLSVRALTDTIAINGKVSTSVFDAASRAITTTTAAGRQSVNTLDAQGRPLGRGLAAGVTPITLTYDSQGRPSQEQQGAQSAAYGYDARNRLVTRTDAAGQVTRYGYDDDDRVISATLPGGETYRYMYDANGNRTSVVMPNGAVHKLTYTPLDQQASYTPPGNGGYARSYDLDRALTSLTLPSGRAVLSTYDSGGRPTGLAYPDATVTFGYASGDTTDRIGGITRQPSNGGAPQGLAYTYDGALTRSVTASGAAQGAYTYGYDNNFYLTDMSLTSGSDTVDTPVGRDADGLLTGYGPFTVARGGPGGAPQPARRRHVRPRPRVRRAGANRRVHRCRG